MSKDDDDRPSFVPGVLLPHAATSSPKRDVEQRLLAEGSDRRPFLCAPHSFQPSAHNPRRCKGCGFTEKIDPEMRTWHLPKRAAGEAPHRSGLIVGTSAAGIVDDIVRKVDETVRALMRDMMLQSAPETTHLHFVLRTNTPIGLQMHVSLATMIDVDRTWCQTAAVLKQCACSRELMIESTFEAHGIDGLLSLNRIPAEILVTQPIPPATLFEVKARLEAMRVRDYWGARSADRESEVTVFPVDALPQEARDRVARREETKQLYDYIRERSQRESEEFRETLRTIDLQSEYLPCPCGRPGARAAFRDKCAKCDVQAFCGPRCKKAFANDPRHLSLCSEIRKMPGPMGTELRRTLVAHARSGARVVAATAKQVRAMEMAGMEAIVRPWKGAEEREEAKE